MMASGSVCASVVKWFFAVVGSRVLRARSFAPLKSAEHQDDGFIFQDGGLIFQDDGFIY